ncbi:MAG: hypothetical protein K6C30_05295 [Bacteroidaceae bacterium]|nr:hypothetical protein [Bacteroidaceae bacterium]
MKKIFLTTMIALLLGAVNTIQAQDNRSDRRQEMQARQTERLVKELKLEGEKKTQFETIYARYQEELAATRQQQRRDDADRSKKDLTDEEATAQLNAIFTRQAEQIQQQQLRLDIQKKYCAELSSVLTPQQLLTVFNQQGGRQGRQMQGRQMQGGARGGAGGGFGGGPGGF